MFPIFNKKNSLLLIFIILFFAPILCLFWKSTAIAEQNLKTFHFGVPPYQKGQSVDEIREFYKPLLVWLGKEVGCLFDFVSADSYEDMIEMIATGKVHLASLGPTPYIKAKMKNPGLKLLLTHLQWNEDNSKLSPYYHGYIVALKTREDINGLSDLKGKKFAFVNLHSTSGYKYPNALMHDQGIIPESFFSKTYFLGSHPRVTDAIAARSIDAGATWDFNLQQAMKKHGDIFKIIYNPAPIPNDALIAHPTLPRGIREKIIKKLPSIDPVLLQGQPADGFAVLPESFYDPIRAITRQR